MSGLDIMKLLKRVEVNTRSSQLLAAACVSSSGCIVSFFIILLQSPPPTHTHLLKDHIIKGVNIHRVTARHLVAVSTNPLWYIIFNPYIYLYVT